MWLPIMSVLLFAVTSSCPEPNVYFSSQFSITLSLCSSLNVTYPRFTNIKRRQDYSFGHFNFYISGHQKGRKKAKRPVSVPTTLGF
jgi:hypothetical protein